MNLCVNVVAQTEEKFNNDWYFIKYGQDPDDAFKWISGFGALDFDGQEEDSSEDTKRFFSLDFPLEDWRAVTLPHDWGMDYKFKLQREGLDGKLPWRGISWYRKSFDVPKSDYGKKVYIHFSGVMGRMELWLNGKQLKTSPSSHVPQEIELTKALRYGKKNLLCVKVDTSKVASSHYRGGGLYGGVSLVKTGSTYIDSKSFLIKYETSKRGLASLDLSMDVLHLLEKDIHVNFRFALFSQGQKVSQYEYFGQELKARRKTAISLAVKVPQIKLWNLSEPESYVIRFELVQGEDEVVDFVERKWALKKVQVKHNGQLSLNDQEIKIKGVCLLKSFGVQGLIPSLDFVRQIIIKYKEMGVNIIRFTDGAPQAGVLSICDELGMGVFIDLYEEAYSEYVDVSEDEWQKNVDLDISQIITNYDSHPSILAWGTGQLNTDKALSEAGMLVSIIKKYANKIPVYVSTANDYDSLNGLADFLVFDGSLAQAGPEVDVLGRSARTLSTRGEFSKSLSKVDARKNYQVSAYDIDTEEGGSLPDQNFKWLKDNPDAMGEFVFLGMDILGWPFPYEQQNHEMTEFTDSKLRDYYFEILDKEGTAQFARSSYSGILDSASLPKERYYLYQSQWRNDKPVLKILPSHWNWKKRSKLNVLIYTNGDEVELFLNDKSLGKKKKSKYRLAWKDVSYEKGVLKAVAYKNGKIWKSELVKSSGDEAAFEVRQFKGLNDSVIEVQLNDKDGVLCGKSSNRFKLILDEGLSLKSWDNGNANNLMDSRSTEMRFFNGKCVITLDRSELESEAKITLKSEGLNDFEYKLMP